MNKFAKSRSLDCHIGGGCCDIWQTMLNPIKKGGHLAAFFKGRGAERSLAHSLFALKTPIGSFCEGL
jgi:hypothetical protein